MPKYMLQAAYTDAGLKGLAAEGGTKRVKDIRAAIKSLGGKLEAFYFCFGDTDAVLIVDLPDNASATAASLMAGETGTVNVITTPLVTPEEMDAATEKAAGAKYRPPGGESA